MDALAPTASEPQQRRLTSDEVLRIANEDAMNAYQDVSDFQISMRLRADGWHVEYAPSDPDVHGGGPHYVIDPVEGTIKSKKYYQ
jgi:hypothetical protein